MLLSRKNIQNL